MKTRLGWLALVQIGLAACSAPKADGAPPRARDAGDTSVLSGSWSPELVRPAAPRVVAIGDLHGDLEATRRALRLAGAIDDADRWIGGALVVVQTGDAIDRGDDDRAVLDLLARLHDEAARSGGALLALSGNHELMNVANDFRYVTPGGFASFAGEHGRADAFRPGGPYALLLARRPIVMKVGDTLFVHGGILPKHVAYGLGRMQGEVSAWLRGTRPTAPEIVMAEDGPIWTRAYSSPSGPIDCAQLSVALALAGAKRMVIGHTIQPGGISTACDQRVWRIDVGMSRFYGGPVQVLELHGDAIHVRTERAKTVKPMQTPAHP